MSIEAYRMAAKEVETRRQNAILEAEARKSEVFAKNIAVKRICLQLSSTCEKLSSVIFSGTEHIEEHIQEIMRENQQQQRRLTLLLTECGYPEDYLDVPYTCSVCSDTGFHLGKRCECLKALIVKNSVNEFNNNGHVNSKCSFENFSLEYYDTKPISENTERSERTIMSEIFENCKQYSMRFSKNANSILMVGGTGLGKTHLSVSIAQTVMMSGFSVLYTSAPDLFRKLQNEYYGRGDGSDTMETIYNADLVLLDDLGAEIENQFAASALYNIINLRLNCEKPTIISTNLTIPRMEARYGDRVTSRLTTLYRCLKFVGKDVRQLKLKQTAL